MQVQYKKCPKCELNWIKLDQDLCVTCKMELKGQPTKSIRTTWNKPFPQKCTLHKQIARIEANSHGGARSGYVLKNINDEMIGVVIANYDYDDRAVIRFCNNLTKEYGTWHLLKEGGISLRMTAIREKFKTCDCFEIIVD